MIRKKYETAFLFNKIKHVTGTRYNIRPDLDDLREAEVSGLYTKETTAGFFRAYTLTPVHMGLVKFINKYGFLSMNQLISLGERAVWPGTDLNNIIYQCVAYGLLFKNQILFDNYATIDLFGLDTGGYFALEEVGTKQNKLLYTQGIDERLNIYRKAVYLVRYNNSQTKNIYMLEDIIGEVNLKSYTEKTLLFDSKIAKILNIEQQISEMVSELNSIGARVVDISNECGFNLDTPTAVTNIT